jgi:hypothetical protein
VRDAELHLSEGENSYKHEVLKWTPEKKFTAKNDGKF